MNVVNCPNCQTANGFSSDHEGKSIQCQKCQWLFQAPVVRQVDSQSQPKPQPTQQPVTKPKPQQAFQAGKTNPNRLNEPGQGSLQSKIESSLDLSSLKGMRKYAVVPLLLAIAFGAFLYFGPKTQLHQWKHTKGIVQSITKIDKGDRTSKRREVVAGFEVNGETYQCVGPITLNSNIYLRGKLSLYYSPNDPSQCSFRRPLGTWNLAGYLRVGAWGGVIFGCLLAIVLMGVGANVQTETTVKNTNEKNCLKCGQEVEYWNVILKKTNHPLMAFQQSSSAHRRLCCPNCHHFRIVDAVLPLVNLLRVPASLVLAFLVGYIVSLFLHEVAVIFWAGATFWMSTLLVGWPLQFALAFFAKLKGTNPLEAETYDQLRQKGRINQDIFQYGFAQAITPTSILLIAKKVPAYDRITKGIVFMCFGIVLLFITLVLASVLISAGAPMTATVLQVLAVMFLMILASYLIGKDVINSVAIEFSANSVTFRDNGPVPWSKQPSKTIERSEVKQLFVDRTRKEHSSDGQTTVVITHSLSLVTNDNRRVGLVTIPEASIGELLNAEKAIEQYWGIQNQEVASFSEGVTTFVGGEQKGPAIQTRGQGINAKIPIGIALGILLVILLLANGWLTFNKYWKDQFQGWNRQRLAQKAEERKKNREESQKKKAASQPPTPEEKRNQKQIELESYLKLKLGLDRSEIADTPFDILDKSIVDKKIALENFYRWRKVPNLLCVNKPINQFDQKRIFSQVIFDPPRVENTLKVRKVVENIGAETYFDVANEYGLRVYCDTAGLKKGTVLEGRYFISLETTRDGFQIAYEMPESVATVCYLLLATNVQDADGTILTRSHRLYDWVNKRCREYWGLPVASKIHLDIK